MRTAAKVFIIIGMVILFWLIYPIVFGILCLKKIDDPNTSEDDFTTWGVVAIFTVSVLGGIFMLLIPTEEKSRIYVTKPSEPQNSSSDTANTNSPDYIEKLKELKDLYDSGVITEQEFIDLKAKLLNK